MSWHQGLVRTWLVTKVWGSDSKQLPPRDTLSQNGDTGSSESSPTPDRDVQITELLQLLQWGFVLPNFVAPHIITHGQVGKSDLELSCWLCLMLRTAAKPVIT